MIKETCHISRGIVITINCSFHFDEVFDFCFASRFRKYKHVIDQKFIQKCLFFSILGKFI